MATQEPKTRKQQLEKQWRERNPEKRREINNRCYQKRREEVLRKKKIRYAALPPAEKERRGKLQRGYKLKSVFGITDEMYNQLMAAQGDVCAICRRPCSTGNRLAVDHDHETGTVRGLLCRRCNLLLGYAEDDSGRLRTAIHYLERAWQRR